MQIEIGPNLKELISLAAYFSFMIFVVYVAWKLKP